MTESVLVGPANRDQTDGLLPEHDLELITRVQVQHSCVGHTDQRGAVALHLGCVGELAASFAKVLGMTRSLHVEEELHTV